MICQGLTHQQSNDLFQEAINDRDKKALRALCINDLYFLLTIGCKRKDINHPWLYDRCREVEANPNGYLDLWGREHYKSTIITFGKSIQDLLTNPDTTIGIFSHTRPIAKGFLEQIKRELETNAFLKNLFPEILYEKPQSESPKWSLDNGILVKRKNNPKEASIEAWGLVDGQPTGKHYNLLVYDDVVTRESITTSEQIKKVTEAWELSVSLGSQGGQRRHIGTRYHANDTYRVLMDRQAVIPRIKPATDNGKMDGEPVFLSKELLDQKRRDMGPYTFSCFPASSPVLMADWTDKPIEQIKVGDEVVGYTLNKREKSKLIKSKVRAVNVRLAEVIEATFESGRVIQCTPDHKWYTGRRGRDSGGKDTHLTYVPLGFDKHSTKGLISVYDPRHVNAQYDELASAWLSGFFDGEGSTSGGSIRLHQTCGRNLVVCEKLEAVLKILNYDYGVFEGQRDIPNLKREPYRSYYLRGGREENIRFLRQCKPARSLNIIKELFENGTRNFGKTNKDKLVSIKHVGEKSVYNIQTETGNYVCYGYATKNCQLLLDPVADKSMGFKEEWLKYYENLNSTKNFNIYILVDPASKKKKSNDYTVMEVIGLAPDGNYYLIDAIRDRLNLTQRTQKVFELHRQYNPIAIGYEQYGMQSDIEHILYVQEKENYRFNIVELGGSAAKEDRIQKLVPVYEQGRFYMPQSLYFNNYENKRVNYIEDFIKEEYLSFPVSTHDDMLDCRARILDPKLDAKFPLAKPRTDQSYDYSSSGANGWLG